MKHILAITLACALSACASGGGSSGSGTAPIAIGAFVRPSGNTSTEAMVTAFEASLGQKLAFDDIFVPLAWSSANLDRWHWDVATGHTPFISWTPGFTGHCATFADILAGKYDATLKAQAAEVPANLPLWISLFPEPMEGCNLVANPTHSGALYQQAWAYIRAIFAADTSITWVFAPNDADYSNGSWQAFRPASFDVLGEDHFTIQTPAPFSADVCTDGPRIKKPFAITSTGAIGDAAQVEWFNTVKADCPGLSAFVYFDDDAAPYDYRISAPDAFAALAGVGK